MITTLEPSVVLGETDYVGFGINGAADASMKARISRGTTDPNGVLTAPRGALYMRESGVISLYQNTDGATAWVRQI